MKSWDPEKLGLPELVVAHITWGVLVLGGSDDGGQAISSPYTAYTRLHYSVVTTLHYTTLHYTTLHYITLHYTTLHYTTLLLLI